MTKWSTEKGQDNGKGKTHKSNRQNQSTTGKLGKP